MGVGQESVSGRENRCKGPVAGRNIAHPASYPRNFKKVCVTGAWSQKWRSTRQKLEVSTGQPDTELRVA